MKWNLTTYSGVVYDGYLWFSNNNCNGLFKMSINSGDISLVGFFPYENRLFVTFKKCILAKGKLYFIPGHANNIHVYDLNSGEFLSVAIKKGKSEFCADAALVGEQIYIFPADRSQGLLKFDIEKLRLSEVPDFVKTCETATSLDDDILLCRISEESNRIYFALYKTDVVGYFDKITEKTKIYHTGIDDIFSCFVSDDICWIITNHGGDVYRFDFMHKPELVHEESNKYRSTRRFNRILRYAGKIWLLPAYPGTVLSIDVDSIIDEYDTYCGLEEDKICLFGSANVNGEEWLLPFGKCDLYKIGIDGSILKKFPFILVDEKSKKQIISGIIQQRDGLVSEDNSIGLKDFLITL